MQKCRTVLESRLSTLCFVLNESEDPWHPKIDFVNLMKSEPSTVFGGSPKVFNRFRSGQMKYAEPLNMRFSCPFNFNLFPLPDKFF